MKKCCMCLCEFKIEELDFLERCEPCFHKYMEMPEDTRPNIGKPFVPIYNGDRYKS